MKESYRTVKQNISVKVKDRLNRLSNLSGTDEGFFVLALHSFMESYVKEFDNLLRYEDTFPELMWAFGEILKTKHGIAGHELRPLIRIAKEHAITNRVRHDFVKIDREETLAAVHNFLRFCSLCSLDDPVLKPFQESLKLWEDKYSPLARSEQLRKLKFQLVLSQRENEKLAEKLAGLNAEQQKIRELNVDIHRLIDELEKEKLRASSKGDRVDSLRSELNKLKLQKKEMQKELGRYHDLEQYVEYLDRFTLYTRTRMDYERSIMKLTPEQQEVVGSIDLSHDFLIKGGAGTGKTLVLLHALNRVCIEKARELDLLPKKKTILLTYTNTLVKYNRYLAEIMGSLEAEQLIQTADRYFLYKLQEINHRYRVDYKCSHELCQKYNTTDFMSTDELCTEIEEFIFGNDISKEEYIDSRIVRRGMRQPLSVPQRTIVWNIKENLIKEMERTGALSKNYSRIKIIQHLENADYKEKQTIDYIFLDESQDLTAVDLRTMKLLASRAVMMAGDTDQSIYGIGSPYKRAGIEIVGRTKILKTNFRNTCPIHDVAELYRQIQGEGTFGDENVPKAFREGPVPELYISASQEELHDLLIRKVLLFIDKLGYALENLTILAPTNADLTFIGTLLRSKGYEAANIREEEFSFKQEKIIRLSTLHSSKGLDFPVVLLYLGGLILSPQYDERSADKLLHNLIYVAMTRAMDNLNIFTLAEPEVNAVKDLITAFQLYHEQQVSEQKLEVEVSNMKERSIG